MASLLLRFIEPDAGLIEVDGRPLSELPLTSWRASLAWVPQRPHLFDGTIADNIRLARPEASDQPVIEAAERPTPQPSSSACPERFDTPVGDAGARLSGGQRQRIAIARAFLRDAPLLVLDEATSYQDEASEAAIGDALERLVIGRTVLVIAHRLKLAQRADRIAVLERGRVVESGSPAQLLAAAGAYRRLVEDHGDALDGEVSELSDLRRLLRLVLPHWRWLRPGVLFGVIAIGSNVALMGLSAYLISKAAIATRRGRVGPRRHRRAGAGHLAGGIPLPRALHHASCDVPHPFERAGVVLSRPSSRWRRPAWSTSAAATC